MTQPAAEAFFLPAGAGERFCLLHAPAGAWRGALVYLHPFAEEMNQSRRTAALQARALAAAGVGVLQIDLHGCGDSDGDFADASWDSWLADAAAARAWLARRAGMPAGLWGLRLGALLALDCARRAGDAPGPLLLWQPVHSGASMLTQFLRLRVAADMLADDGAAKASTQSMRAQLQAGTALEVAGYTLTPALAAALDALDGAALVPPVPVQWIEVVASADRALPPAAERLAAGWRAAGARVSVRSVAAPAFWATAQAEPLPELMAATCAAVAEACDGSH